MPTTSKSLKTLIIMGSSRNSEAAWGGSARLGSRVLEFVKKELSVRSKVRHDFTVFDQIDPQFSLDLLEKPHFFYAKGTAPEKLEKMAKIVEEADSYILISPEYNHSVGPALINFLDHFGGSLYAKKASGLVTYSVGPFGGVRGIPNLRAITGELGCLSVSTVFSVPTAGDSLDASGSPSGENGQRLVKSLDAMLSQLEWTSLAFKSARAAE